MKSSAKAKSFHVAVRGRSPQHVTLPSRILIQRPRPDLNHHGTTYQPPRHRVNDHPPTSDTRERYERVVATEPQTIKAAEGSLSRNRNHELGTVRLRNGFFGEHGRAINGQTAGDRGMKPGCPIRAVNDRERWNQ